jgi:hypothetical protein
MYFVLRLDFVRLVRLGETHFILQHFVIVKLSSRQLLNKTTISFL